MKCPFCAAESAPQANFCSDCGSPLHLKVCPKCEAVNEKTAGACMKCGEPLAAQDESTVAPASDSATAATPEPMLVDATAASSSESTSVSEIARPASPISAGSKEWKVLLQEVEDEVHRQLDAEPQVAKDSADEAMRAAAMVADPQPTRSDADESVMAGEVKRSRSTRSAVMTLVLLVAVGGAIVTYYFRSWLPGVTAAANRVPNNTAGASAGSDASLSANPDLLRDEAKNSREATATTSGSPPAEINPSMANPSPPPVEANSTATTTAVPPSAVEQTTDTRAPTESKNEPAAPSSSPAARADSARQPAQSEPAGTKTRPAPRTTKRADDIAERLSAERRAVVETPAPRPTEPLVPETRPCSEAMQAMALCSAPAPSAP